MGLQTPSTSFCLSAYSWHSSIRGTSGLLVELADDGTAHTFNLLLFVRVLLLVGRLVEVEPLYGLVTLVVDNLLLVGTNLILQLLIVKSGLHVKAVGLEIVLGGYSLLL